MQFREFRNYVYGDDVRHISWTVSARTDEPVLKTFEEERERNFLLLVDSSASLRKGAWAQQKAERLAEIAASLALSAAEADDKIGMIIYSDKVEKTVNPSKGKTHVLRVIRDVLGFNPEGSGTDPDVALKHVDKVIKKHAIIFFLSDMEVMPDERLLRRVAQKHELIAVDIEHPHEYEWPNVGFLEIQTAEQERPVTLDTSSKALRRYIRAQGSARRESIKRYYQRLGIDLISISTDEEFVPQLKKFFQMRIQRGRR